MYTSVKKWLFAFLILIFSCCIAVIGISYYALTKLVYVADPLIYGKKQSDLGQEIRDELNKRSDVQNVSYFSQDGLVLAGCLIKRPNAKANMVLCHGYRVSKEFMYGYIDLFPQFNILLFDFRAHGQSQGSVISVGCHEYKDVIASANFMKNHLKTEEGKNLPLIVLGISMGGASAIKALEVKKDLCDALVIDSTFSDLKRALKRGLILKSGLPYTPFYNVISKMFQYFGSCNIADMDIADAIEKIDVPTMLIHSCNDKFLKPSNVIRLYERTGSRHVKLWIGPKCRHGWLHSYYSDLYKKKVLRFLKKAKIISYN